MKNYNCSRESIVKTVIFYNTIDLILGDGTEAAPEETFASLDLGLSTSSSDRDTDQISLKGRVKSRKRTQQSRASTEVIHCMKEYRERAEEKQKEEIAKQEAMHKEKLRVNLVQWKR